MQHQSVVMDKYTHIYTHTYCIGLPPRTGRYSQSHAFSSEHLSWGCGALADSRLEQRRFSGSTSLNSTARTATNAQDAARTMNDVVYPPPLSCTAPAHHTT